MSESQPILSVRNLQVSFPGAHGAARVVDGVTFQVAPGETLAIVGESGSGKSLTSLALLGLVPRPGVVSGGEIIFEGRDLARLSEREFRRIRGSKLAMVFQDPMTSLNPFLPVGMQIAEATRVHFHHSRIEARRHAVEMLERVGIPDARIRSGYYPHQFSGGMRQRIMIAMALACQPRILIADEPTTALDVTIQAQILHLLHNLKEDGRIGVILITHDLGIVAENADFVSVMYAGRIMESASAAELFRNPQNPYTRALLQCAPDPARRGELLFQINGQPPDPSGLSRRYCPFVERCSESIPRCRDEYPPFHAIGPNHTSLCWVR